MRQINVSKVSDLAKYRTNLDKMEKLWYPLFDYTAYAAAGQTNLTFFQNPVGQSSKTSEDTNMEAAGMIPAPKYQLVTGIEVRFWPAASPAAYGASTNVGKYVNDVYKVMKSGWLDFVVGSKSQLVDGPLENFASRQGLFVAAALSDATTAGANLTGDVEYARSVGTSYDIDPVLIEPNNNFKVTLNWATAVALPSSAAGRIGVRLLGYQFRPKQ